MPLNGIVFSALKIFKISYIEVRSKYSIFSERFSWLTCVDFFSQVGIKSGVWKTAYFYPPVFVDFSIAIEAI